MGTIVLSLLIASQSAMADFEFKQPETDEVALTVGTWLPWGGIRGVIDQYRMWALSYYHPSSIWNLEYQFLNARGLGVTFYSLSAGIRVDIEIEKTLELFLLGGLDYHYYQRAPYFGQEFSYVSSGGIHLGFGGFYAIAERLKLRFELKFLNGPGKSIYVGVGPAFLF